jgi:hypothetical protein
MVDGGFCRCRGAPGNADAYVIVQVDECAAQALKFGPRIANQDLAVPIGHSKAVARNPREFDITGPHPMNPVS